MSASAPSSGPGPWAIERSVVSTILVGSALVLLLLALAAAIELPERDRRPDSVDAAGAANGGGGSGLGSPGAGFDPGAGSGGSSGSAGASGAEGTIDLGNGMRIPVEAIPGCPGGLRLGDAMIVPDPEACDLERLESASGSGQEILVPDPNGAFERFGVDGDGSVRALGPGERAGIEFGISSLPGGRYALRLPDGSVVPIAPDESTPGGGSDPFGGQAPDPAQPEQFDAAQPDSATDPAQSSSDDDDERSNVFWLVAALVLMALVAIAWLLLRRHRRRQDSASPVEPDPGPESYAVEMNALDLLLWEIDQEKDPRRAIQRSFAALETGLDRPDMARRRSETADAYVRRVLLRFDDLEAPLREFAELFERARFSQHEITPEMRDRAVRALVEARGQFARAAAGPPAATDALAASAATP